MMFNVFIVFGYFVVLYKGTWKEIFLFVVIRDKAGSVFMEICYILKNCMYRYMLGFLIEIELVLDSVILVLERLILFLKM